MYSLKNLGSNKRFPYAAVGAPVSNHDARLLKESSIYAAMLDADIMPNKVIRLDDFGEIPLVTIGNSAFSQCAWLLKMYNENTRDKEQKYFNKGRCGARVVTENAYDMLKGKWRFLYKKQNVDFSTYVTSSWNVSHRIAFAYTGLIFVSLEGG